MSIRFFGYFAGCRYLSRFLRHESSRSKYPSPVPSALSSVFRPVPLDPRRGPRRISHITFRESPPPSPLPSPPPPFAPSLLARSWSARSKRFYARAKSRLSYLASLLGEDLSCGTHVAFAYKVPVDLREVGRQPRGKRTLLNFV